ncbi:MAG: hypothetical protein ACT4PL_10510 [Phycisphaerales bacterium]
MLGKVCFLILGIGATACGLLGYRQLRLQTLHDLAQVQRRLNEHDRDLFRLRSEIAEFVTPDRVAEMARILGPLVSIGVNDGSKDLPAASPPRLEIVARPGESPSARKPRSSAAGPINR